MASVFHYGPYGFYIVNGFYPGQEQPFGINIGGGNSTVTVSAHPFPYSTATNRRLQVTNLQSVWAGGEEYSTQCTIRNVGTDPIYIYYVHIGGTLL